MQNPLVVIAPIDHPLTSEKQISLARLQGESFVAREPGSGTFIAMERFYPRHGVKLTTGMEMTRNKAIK